MKKELIFISNEINFKEETIDFLVEQVSRVIYIIGMNLFRDYLREKIGDTSWENGGAIPHFMGDVIKSSFISLLYI